jgi:hypothetical protein
MGSHMLRSATDRRRSPARTRARLTTRTQGRLATGDDEAHHERGVRLNAWSNHPAFTRAHAREPTREMPDDKSRAMPAAAGLRGAMSHPDPDRTRLDPYPAVDPPTMQQNAAASRVPEPPPVSAPRTSGPYEDEIVEEGVANPDYRRIRTVSLINTIITVITATFAVVLGVHIVLVLGSANMANGFASFVDGWADGITLGLTGLFTPGNAKIATLLNEGIAAILWLAIGGVLCYLIRRLALPGPRRLQRYRRVVR